MQSCVAPLCDAIRYNESMHCSTHAHKFSSMYTKYKKAQVPIDKYINNTRGIERLDNKSLLRLVGVCNNVALLRKEYQLIAFKKQFHDDGHISFISKLLDLCNVITKMLEVRFNIVMHDEPQSEDDEVDVIHTPDESTRETIKVFATTRDELTAELDMLVRAKTEYVSSIRSKVMEIYDMINPLLKNGNLHVEDRAAVFICALDIVGSMYTSAVDELMQEEMMLGGLIEQGLEKFNRLVEYKGTIPQLNHVSDKRTLVINWAHIPSSLDEAIEYIYQGKRRCPVVPDDLKVLEATAALIDAARTQSSTFSWHFDIDMFDNDKIHVHVFELKGAKSTYYPKQFKKR